MIRLHNYIISILAYSCIVFSQVTLSISDYYPFPSELSDLNVNPDVLEWGVAGSFLLLDQKENQLVSIGSLNGFQTVGGFGLNSYSFTEPVWVGVEPNGISVLDRLENKIILLDYRLNYMTAISLEPRIFPELAVIDKYGLIYIYSSQYHSIFKFESKRLRKIPHIDLNRFSNIDYCINKLAINQDGDFGLLDCNNFVYLFSKNGAYKGSYSSEINKPIFLVPIREYWFVFNDKGDGESVFDKSVTLHIPDLSTPIVDIKNMNRSLAILSKDHISILNVKLK